MEAKTKLKRWLCRLLGCDVPDPALPVVHKNGNLEVFQYDGYDMEVHLYPSQLKVRIKIHLKGKCVLIGDCRLGEAIQWHEGLHYPSYKTRKYMQEYATKRLTQLKDNK
jgi:hypothetical protein